MIRIRPMRGEEIPAGLELCRLAGWNQLESDWQRMLALAPDGVVVAEEAGRVCGTGSAVRHGTRLGWIGMILVHPDFRRQGIGSAIMSFCIEHLQAHGVESIGLDATDQGRPVYLKLGFADAAPIRRALGSRPAGLRAHPEVHPIGEEEWPAVAALDREAFDADRMPLLRQLETNGDALVAVGAGGIEAYGFSRPGFLASHVGPVVAANADAGRRVVETLLARLPEGQVLWDYLPGNVAARALAEESGFAPIRELTRMFLGAQRGGRMERLFAGAGFEVG